MCRIFQSFRPKEKKVEPPEAQPCSVMKSIARVLTAGILGLVFVCLSPLLAVLWICRLIYGAMLKLWWWRKHGQHGRDFLVVYSESPKWSETVSERILPVLGPRAVVENISKDSSWKTSRSLERRVHKHWAGRVEHTPIVIKVPPFAKVVQVRFYKALVMNANKGNPSLLEERLAAVHALVRSSAG